MKPFPKNRNAWQNRCVGLDRQVVAALVQSPCKYRFSHDKDYCKLEKTQLVDKNQPQ
jgi:hypothetical protein